MEAIPKKEKAPVPTVEVEVVQGNLSPDTLCELSELHRLAFEGKSGIALWRPKFEKGSFLIILRTESGRVIGYMSAHPAHEAKTASIYSTVIAPDFRGQGLSSKLEDKMEEELKRNGYEFIRRDAVKANGYADGLTRRYGDRVVSSLDYTAALGPAREMKIRL